MKILVCVKYVPDPDHVVFHASENGRIVIGEMSEFRMNRFDEFAVEEALRIREGKGDVSIDVLTIGPARSRDVLRRAMGMGADSGVHLETPVDGYISPMTKAAWIAGYANGKGYSLILTGAMSEDMMNAQVGPMVAAFLGLPCATQVIQTRLPSVQGSSSGAVLPDVCPDIYVEREIEGGSREMMTIDLPAVLAVQTGINEPRYPSLSNLLRANKQEIEIIAAASPEGEASGETDAMVEMVMPEKNRAGMHLNGSPSEKAEQLIAILREKAFIS